LFIMEETFLVLTSSTFYNTHFYHTTFTFLEPRGLDLFTKALVEAGINKDLIKIKMSIYCQKWQRTSMKCRNLRVILKASMVKRTGNLIRVIMKATMMMMMIIRMTMSPRN
jgi:hypothetical protein